MKLEEFQIWNRKWKGQLRYNEVPRDWQNAFAITRFRYIEVLFHIFYHFCDQENRWLYRGLQIHSLEVRFIEVLLYMYIIYIYLIYAVAETHDKCRWCC